MLIFSGALYAPPRKILPAIDCTRLPLLGGMESKTSTPKSLISPTKTPNLGAHRNTPKPLTAEELLSASPNKLKPLDYSSVPKNPRIAALAQSGMQKPKCLTPIAGSSKTYHPELLSLTPQAKKSIRKLPPIVPTGIPQRILQASGSSTPMRKNKFKKTAEKVITLSSVAKTLDDNLEQPTIQHNCTRDPAAQLESWRIIYRSKTPEEYWAWYKFFSTSQKCAIVREYAVDTKRYCLPGIDVHIPLNDDDPILRINCECPLILNFEGSFLEANFAHNPQDLREHIFESFNKVLNLGMQFSEHNNEHVLALNFSRNELKLITQQFLAPMVHFKNLEWIDISHNRLMDIPKEILALKNLHYLNASHNKIEELSIGHLPRHLIFLDLSDNYFSDIPSVVFNLIHLTELNISNNYITSIEDTITHLIRLKHLNLSSNAIMIIPEVIEKIESLEFVNVADNPLPIKSLAYFILLEKGILKIS